MAGGVRGSGGVLSPGKPIRALIVDDEPQARRAIRILLSEDPEIEVVAEAANVEEAVRAIEAREPDLLYLDVQMPGADGFAALDRIDADRMPWVIFVTAHEEHALRAFDSDAVDYLLKPYTDRRFETALERAKRQIRLERAERVKRSIEDLVRDPDAPGPAPSGRATDEGSWARRFVIKETGRIFFVDVDRVRWISAEGHYVRLHTEDGESHLLRSGITEMEKRLDPERFVRIHRSTIVRLDAVEEFALWEKGRYVAILEDGERLRISRSGYERLQSRLENPF